MAQPAEGDLEPVASTDTGDNWAPTRALGRAVLLAGLLLVAAVLLGRTELVILAAPLALSVAFALGKRPRTLPGLRLSTVESFPVEGGDLGATVEVENRDTVGYDLTVVQLQHSPWLRLEGGADPNAPRRGPRGGNRPYVTFVPRGVATAVELAGPAVRWGRHWLGPASAHAVAADGLLVSRAVVTGALGVKVYPLTDPFKADEAMPRAAGLVGQHRSRRPGEGGELAGVRQFAPGDRLRRVDWRVSLRTERLHVAATLSDRDAEVVVLLDLLADAGRSEGVGGTASVLDRSVRAAAAIAEHYLHRGDRVSVLEYGAQARRLRPASGRRQYLTVLEWLLDAHPSPTAQERGGAQLAAGISSAALVVVLTPLLDARSAAMLAGLSRSGRFVVAVDTLPSDLTSPTVNSWTDLSHRLWRAERENTMGQLGEHGVPVVAWAGAGSLDAVLRDVSRLAAAPKAVR
ncbi:DUF58 domain-containing protein [Catellatospora bangladeshensis]|uniref:DUF58 domain-containing protein n=1 Tax=Catellatospora bangladeshensis TaxID=310355 RepID=A0A8J3JR37_9ACTN|nr:DUF58 domain-containing protein [Catellatospora bangladeshensis]GIF85396.1 hypothetical protein Cba03nite_67450 [Catellatospora bangladeshensis]